MWTVVHSSSRRNKHDIHSQHRPECDILFPGVAFSGSCHRLTAKIMVFDVEWRLLHFLTSLDAQEAEKSHRTSFYEHFCPPEHQSLALIQSEFWWNDPMFFWHMIGLHWWQLSSRSIHSLHLPTFHSSLWLSKDLCVHCWLWVLLSVLNQVTDIKGHNWWNTLYCVIGE